VRLKLVIRLAQVLERWLRAYSFHTLFTLCTLLNKACESCKVVSRCLPPSLSFLSSAPGESFAGTGVLPSVSFVLPRAGPCGRESYNLKRIAKCVALLFWFFEWPVPTSWPLWSPSRMSCRNWKFAFFTVAYARCRTRGWRRLRGRDAKECNRSPQPARLQ